MLNNNNKMNNNINTILHHLLGGKHGIEELNNILKSEILLLDENDAEEIHFIANFIYKAATNHITKKEMNTLQHALTEVCINLDDRDAKHEMKREIFYSRWLALASFWEGKSSNGGIPWRLDVVTPINIMYCLKHNIEGNQDIIKYIQEGYYIKDLHMESLGADAGFNSKMARITLVWSNTTTNNNNTTNIDNNIINNGKLLPIKLIIKVTPLPPEVNNDFRVNNRRSGMGYLEGLFYSNGNPKILKHDLGLKLPRIYFSTYQENLNRSVIVS